MKKSLLISTLSYAMSMPTFAYVSQKISLDIEQGIATGISLVSAALSICFRHVNVI